MWLIDKKTFNSDRIQCDLAFRNIQMAAESRQLTIVVGNSPSRASVLLHSLEHCDNGSPKRPVAWSDAVRTAAKKADVEKKFHEDPDINLLALAEAVVVRLKEKGHASLLEELQAAFEQDIPTTLIHDIMCDLEPGSIVTTNYDFQLERAFEGRGSDWGALIRGVDDCASGGTQILKMHGTLKPPANLSNKYFYPEDKKVSWRASPEKSVVISESDYDACMDELQQAETNVLLRALEKPILILGKSFEWQDLSFLYALRKTRRENRKAYALMTSLSKEEELNLNNLGITPLLINMPVQRQDGHYYVGLVKALISCFPDFNQRFSKYREEINNFSDRLKLSQKPTFVALGLVSHNTIGRAISPGGNRQRNGRTIYKVPPAGRRNMRYDAEEYVGGAAMIPMGAFASLDIENNFPRSIISVVGRNDIFKEAISRFCKKKEINFDGIDQSAVNTWRSTVLVHDSKTHDGHYPGQRIFLDRGYEAPLSFSKSTIDQLKQQLNPRQSALKLIYFDKFLALPYPWNTEDKFAQGLLMEHQDLFDALVAKRDDVDIVYETGAGGSQGLTVENRFSRNINILTAGFPFFASNILPDEFWRTIPDEALFRTKWYDMDFEVETKVGDALLRYLGLEKDGDAVQFFKVPPNWICDAKKYVGRPHVRRWFISTLHHYGAMALDLNMKEAVYCPVQYDSRTIQNTTGAGDTFRGAFCYALLNERLNNEEPRSDLLAYCTRFSVRMASEKCRFFRMADAFNRISKLPSEEAENVKS